MNNKKGFTLTELMISMAIMSLIVALTFPAFTNLLAESRGETASEETHIDKIIGLELIRLDLENAAYGIGRNEATPPISLTFNTAIPPAIRALQLNSTLNNTNQSTVGWMIYGCSNAFGKKLSDRVLADRRQDRTNTNIVLLDDDKNFTTTTTTTASCPGSGIYTAFPYAAGLNNACTTQFCTGVRYQLSDTNTLGNCAVGTQNLLRVVGGGGDPVINCVADFTVTFDLDTDGDGVVNSPDAQLLATTTAQIMAQVKNINMYILMQEGQRDNGLNTPNANWSIATNITLNTANVTDANQYRWKEVRISGKPMSL